MRRILRFCIVTSFGGGFVALLAVQVAASAGALAQAAPAGNEVVQYGALGLCGLMVVYQFTQMTRMGKKLDEKDRVIERVVVNNTAAMTDLRTALKDRPCIGTDSRINNMGKERER